LSVLGPALNNVIVARTTPAAANYHMAWNNCTATYDAAANKITFTASYAGSTNNTPAAKLVGGGLVCPVSATSSSTQTITF
jgi:hypothetical protein